MSVRDRLTFSINIFIYMCMYTHSDKLSSITRYLVQENCAGRLERLQKTDKNQHPSEAAAVCSCEIGAISFRISVTFVRVSLIIIIEQSHKSVLDLIAQQECKLEQNKCFKMDSPLLEAFNYKTLIPLTVQMVKFLLQTFLIYIIFWRQNAYMCELQLFV